jgi:hypothetical protein|tara:strand:+ start:1122 stop:1613 length:492 start_codon:yes stop_codon:yes gene_type:complete
MDNETMQYIWDSILIGAFGKRCKMGRVVYDFISQVNPELIEGKLIKHEAYDWMNSLELRRCRDRSTNGDLRFNKHRMTVEDFIGGHSMPMLLALIDRKVSNDEVLKNIRFFKWVRTNDALRAKAKRNNISYAKKKYNEENPDGVRMTISTKARDHSSSWGVVK